MTTPPRRSDVPRPLLGSVVVLLACGLLFTVGGTVRAEEHSPPARVPALLTHTAETPPESPPATLADFSWLAGHWQGPGLDGWNEEAWTAPAGGQMLGMYRLLKQDQVVFMELLTLSEEKGSVMLRLKHFSPDLSGWEAREHAVAFPLLQIEPGAAWFDGYSLFQVDERHMQVWVRIGGQGERPERQVRIDYRRADPR